jgi:hypothetical protein
LSHNPHLLGIILFNVGEKDVACTYEGEKENSCTNEEEKGAACINEREKMRPNQLIPWAKIFPV